MQIRWLLKSGIRLFAFVLVVFVVIVVIRLTPFPDLDAPEETCDRPCHELEWPRICRFQFVLESNRIQSRGCRTEDHCFADEVEYQPGTDCSLTANLQIPGPEIRVCVHDILLIDVINQVPQREVSIHWRGLTQRKNPLMDGVSMVSQCPINSFTTFQYKFRASDPGTHLWHLHNGEHDTSNSNNVHGLLVVRQSVRQEPHKALIDVDDSSHSILLRGVSNQSGPAILINGKLPQFKTKNLRQTFNVTRGTAYRFRVAHTGGTVKCPITGSIEEHTLLVITLDGNPIEPVNTTKFTIAAGERLDFVVRADQNGGKYNMQFEFSECASKSSSFVEIVYLNVKDKKRLVNKSTKKWHQFPLSPPLSTTLTEGCGKVVTCLEELMSWSDIPNTVLHGDVHQVYYLTYGYKSERHGHLAESFRVAHINNISFVPSSSPLASQITDVPADRLCAVDNRPSRCGDTDDICYCTYTIDVQLGSVVELILIHGERNPMRAHIFHLHGYKFHVIGRQTAADRLSPGNERKLRYSEKPVLKDTIVVPRNGSAVIRFLADNAGYWLLEEEGSQGMQLVFNVKGQTHEIPDTFPKCGNWIGPKYFLA